MSLSISDFEQYERQQQQQQQQQHASSLSSITPTQQTAQDHHYRLQRKQRLEAMVLKRKQNVTYLGQIFEGNSYWLNCMFMSTIDIQRYANSVPKQRSIMYFYLGFSISKILELSSGIPTVRAFNQLMEEWEYYFAGAAFQSVKFMLAKNSTCIYPQYSTTNNTNNDNDANDPTRSNVYKFNGSVVYEYLLFPSIPFELDYVEVVIALCESLVQLYDKFLQDECYNNAHIYESIVRLDTKMKHHFINVLAKEITESCQQSSKSVLESLRNGSIN